MGRWVTWWVSGEVGDMMGVCVCSGTTIVALILPVVRRITCGCTVFVLRPSLGAVRSWLGCCVGAGCLGPSCPATGPASSRSSSTAMTSPSQTASAPNMNLLTRNLSTKVRNE